MYKLLLCWRYLRTRYLALICIISVMLGVATLIVVNSVMSGFSNKLRTRLHGLLSDVVIESPDMFGFDRYREKMEWIRNDPILRDKVEAMAATMEVFAMAQFTYVRKEDGYQHPVTRTVRLIGVDPEERAKLGGFKEFLIRMKHSDKVEFKLGKAGKARYRLNHPVIQDQAITNPRWQDDELLDPVPAPPPAPGSGSEQQEPLPEPDVTISEKGKNLITPNVDPEPVISSEPADPWCAVVGHAIVHQRKPGALANDPDRDQVLLKRGEDLILTTVNFNRQEPRPVIARFAVCDYIKTGMSEYDSNIVYVPLDKLQELRAMYHHDHWSKDRVTSIQLKLKDYADAKIVVERLQHIFQFENVGIATWEEKQGALLAAIAIEKGILNVLLFMIIAVAGFGILAIFSMIVMEKTRDIGILKALGASSFGVMKIFLGYGLLLGVVGAVMGTALGLVITDNINDIERFLAEVTGQNIFPRDIYYFDKIPVQVDAMMILLVNAGAIGIAVLFSVLPAMRAAMLHPVRALRFE